MQIELGREVQDKVTGMKGIATSRTEYLNGCHKIGVTLQVDKDGKPQDTWFVDEPQLEYTKNKKQIESVQKTTGGPSIKAKRSTI